MKTRFFWKWNLGVNLTLIAFGAVLGAETPTPPPVSTNLPAATASDLNAAVRPDAAGTNAPAGQPALTEISEAPVKVIQTERPVPPNIKPSSPVSEVIKLANAGVDEGVMLAFVTNSVSTFNLAAEEIIYLNDIGVPGPVVTAMIQRDQGLKSALAASLTATLSTPPSATNPNSPTPEMAPPPAEAVAPQPANGTAPYAAAPPEGTAPAFYNALSPYGTWVDVEGYGSCWQPTVVTIDAGWRPYMNSGHWVYTDAGWYWLSDYSWGWAPFHYGRWFQHHRLGWCWAPDTVWGPSWVSWRYTDAYCGWAPLPPAACYHAGLGFTYYGGPVGVGFGFGLGWGCYGFVSWGHFNNYHLNNYCVPHHQANQIYAHSVVVNNYTVNNNTVINQGIPPQRVAAATRSEVRRMSLSTASHATPPVGHADRVDLKSQTLAVYRPQLPPAPRTATTVSEQSRGEFRRPLGTATTSTVQNTRPIPAAQLTDAHQPSAPGRQATATVANRSETSGTRTGTPVAQPERTAGRINNQPRQFTGPTPSSPGTATGTFNAGTATGHGESSRTAAPSRPAGNTAQAVPPTPATPTPTPSSRPGVARTAPPTPVWANQSQTAVRPPDQPVRNVRGQQANRSDASTATPWLNNRPSATAPATVPTMTPRPIQAPTYQVPARAPSAEVPRYNPAPTYTAPRSYSVPETRSVPRQTENFSAPARPSYTPAPAAPAPVRAPEPRPAPSAPQGSSSRDSSNGGGRNNSR